MRHYTALTCGALARRVGAAAVHSTAVVSVEVLDQGLHETPVLLRGRLQDRIDEVGTDQADAVLLAYGLCGGATAGLVARDVPLVLPRAHDCVTLFLGSRERYQQQFERAPGTYWMSRDYLAGNGRDASFALGSASHAQLVEAYGHDNATYLFEVLGRWAQHYERIAYLTTGQEGDEADRVRAVELAAANGLGFTELASDDRLMVALVTGQWDPHDFLVVPPGHRIAPTSDDVVVGARKVPT